MSKKSREITEWSYFAGWHVITFKSQKTCQITAEKPFAFLHFSLFSKSLPRIILEKKKIMYALAICFSKNEVWMGVTAYMNESLTIFCECAHRVGVMSERIILQ